MLVTRMFQAPYPDAEIKPNYRKDFQCTVPGQTSCASPRVQVVISTDRYSDRSIVRHVVSWTGRYYDKQVDFQTVQ